MTFVYHSSKDRIIRSREPVGHFRAAIFNKNSFLCLPNRKKSKYDGYFVKSKKLWKILDDIKFDLIEVKDADKIVKCKNSVQLFFNFINFGFYIDEPTGALLFESNTEMKMNFLFDIRDAFDQRIWGRHYRVEYLADNTVVIHFIKKTDSREDSTQDEKEFEKYVVIKYNGHAVQNERWLEQEYEYDIERRSPEYKRHVFSPFDISATRFMIAEGDTLEEAMGKIKTRYKLFDKIKNLATDFDVERVSRFEEVDFACASAKDSLLSLCSKDFMAAGAPWFFEEWSRDEAISLIGLILSNEVELTRSYVMNILKNVYYNGKVFAKLGERSHFSIDALPWLFNRVSYLIRFSEKKNISDYFLTKHFVSIFKGSVVNTADLVSKYLGKSHMIYSLPHETWMDSTYAHDSREGFNIEVQAMYLYLNKLAYALTKDEYYKEKEREMRLEVVNNFFNGEILYDNLNSKLVRPNVFIAYYFYPELLSYAQWRKVFDNALKSLWMSWGGLATVDRNSDLYTPFHTGEYPESYHRGDSWYFINNIAAIAMYRLDRTKYSTYIADIISASTKEILWMNALGSAGELSSAEAHTSQGAFNQAWSNATYIELIKEVSKEIR